MGCGLHLLALSREGFILSFERKRALKAKKEGLGKDEDS